MNRKFKFRGKVADEPNEWIYGYLCDENTIYQPNETEHTKCCCKGTFTVRPETIGQFTGLKDKNGTEIYEGDIVKVPAKRHSASNWWQDTNINHGKTGDYVYKKVEYFEYKNSFSENLSGFDLADLPITKKQREEIAKPRGKERTKQCVDDLNYSFNELEVIGNIYDNKNLLEE